MSWHGCKLNGPGWSDPNARLLGVTVGGFDGDADIHVMLMYWEKLDFEILWVSGGGSKWWTRLNFTS